MSTNRHKTVYGVWRADELPRESLYGPLHTTPKGAIKHARELMRHKLYTWRWLKARKNTSPKYILAEWFAFHRRTGARATADVHPIRIRKHRLER